MTQPHQHEPAAQPTPDAGRTPGPRHGGYTDAQGRAELVMHPDIKRGRAAFRLLDQSPDEERR